MNGLLNVIDDVIISLQNSNRPLLLIGHGLVSSDAQDVFREIQSKLKIPVVSTWRALEVMDFDDDYFLGSSGLQANRYSNLRCLW